MLSDLDNICDDESVCSTKKLNVLLGVGGGGGEACFSMEAYETCFWTKFCLEAWSLYAGQRL